MFRRIDFFLLKKSFVHQKTYLVVSDLFQVGFFHSFELDISWQREMAEIVTQFSYRIMFPLSIGTMGVNIGRKISCKQQEIHNWSIEIT